MKKHAIVIIGAGPAGLTAGYFLASKGLDVLIYEKDRHPRKKLCGGLLTEKTILLNNEVFGDNSHRLFEKKIINYMSNKYELFFKNGEKRNFSSEYNYYFTNRELYDYYLYNKTIYAGANVIEGIKINEVDIKNKIIMINKKDCIRYDYLISADGVNSIIRNKYFFDNPKELMEWYSNVGITIQITVDRDDMSPQIYHPQMYYSEINEGYAWVFPNKSQVVLGIVGVVGKEKIKNIFIKFLKKFQFKKELKMDYSLLPYGFYCNDLVKNNTLLTGDAAGLVDPFTGEGIYYAQKSGLLAAKSIINNIEQNIPLRKYSEYVEKEILKDFEYSKIRRKLFFYK